MEQVACVLAKLLLISIAGLLLLVRPGQRLCSEQKQGNRPHVCTVYFIFLLLICKINPVPLQYCVS